MRKNLGLLLFLSISTLSNGAVAPDMRTLSKAGFIIGPEDRSYPIDRAWVDTVQIMKNLEIFDDTVAKMADILCSEDRNRSVLLVGESSQAYKYIFARMANFNNNVNCTGVRHVEIDTSLIESGKSLVGAVDEYWKNNILTPVDRKNAIVYFSSLGALIGLGSHSGDSTGIEQEYSVNLISGRMRSVAFINKWEYQKFQQSENAYVLNAFAETYRLPPLVEDDVRDLVEAYMRELYPNLILTKGDLKYLTNTLEYYQPNVLEPERTINVLNSITRRAEKSVVAGVPYEIKRSEVRKAIFDFVQVPEWLVDKDFEVIKKLEGKLEKDVIGIQDGQKAVVREAKIGYVTGRTNKKPIATILLAGPTGTGKSHLAKSLADAIEMPIVTIDMTAYHSTASFDNFVEVMARNLILQPYAVYLFEEIDKASPEVLDRLYFMMDDGLFYDANQRPLFARGAFIIMTTNAGFEVVLKYKDSPDLKKRMTLRLQEIFRLSFLNRFDSVAISLPFTAEEYVKMTKINYEKKQDKLKSMFNWTLTADQETLDFIAVHGASAVYGSRPNERLMENIFSIGIGEFQLEYGPLASGSEIFITKVPDKKKNFLCTVGDLFVEYEADLDNNPGQYNNFSK